MDNFNNIMDGNMDYQNIVYGGHIQPQQPIQQQQQIHQNIMIQQNPEEVKNDNYTTEETTLPRETIIANSMPQQIVSYQGIEGISQPRVVLEKQIINETTTYVNQESEIPQQVTEDICQENGENKINDTEEKIDENVTTKSEENTSIEEKSADADAENPVEGENETAEEKKENEINLIQCRICLSEENLTDIFQLDESIRISDKIMVLAPNVKIMERDFLPHVICTICIDRVRTAYELKTLIEVTDKDLKSKLRRSKKKSRRTREFVLIDAGFSDTNSEGDSKNPDDDEFHISEDIESEPGSSDSSYASGKKKKAISKRRTPRRRPDRRSTGSSGSKRTRKTPVDEVPDKRPRRDVVYIKAFEESDEEVKPKNQCEVCQKSFRYPSDLRKHMNTHSKTVKSEEDSTKKPVVHQCNICNKIFSKRQLLRDHKKTHNSGREGSKIFPCHICKKEFSKQAALSTHIQRHRDDGLTCMKCRKMFTTKVDLKKHISSVHPDDAAGCVDCPKCKRSFTSKGRLDRHKESSSCTSSSSDPVKKFRNDTDTSFNLGRDLFKAVAPVTTTYWSDSFSD